MRRTVRGHLAVDRDQDTTHDQRPKKQGEAGKEIAYIVNAKQIQGQELAQNDFVCLAKDEPCNSAEENPFSKADQLAGGFRLPAEAVAVSGQKSVADDQVDACADHAAYDQRPDRVQKPGQKDRRKNADDLRCLLNSCDPAQHQMSVGTVKPRWVEPVQQQNKRGDGQILQQQRFVVKQRHRVSQNTGQDPQNRAADHLNGPGGVQEIRVISAFVLHDRRANTKVREHVQPHHEDANKHHHSKGFGEQKAGQDQV